jgi:indole-3-glycerol phosphate synthase
MVTKFRQFLDEIVTYKHQEVTDRRDRLPLSQLQDAVKNSTPALDFCSALRQNSHKPSLIAEVKQASPSKGVIRADFHPVRIAQAYQRGGAACISVLCDRQFFGGGYDNLLAVRQNVSLPLLCKEFIIDPYQIYWARAYGADAILLIAAILSDAQLQEFLEIAGNLGMQALVEVHTLAECDRVLQLSDLRLLGINNRDLETFKVDLNVTKELLDARRLDFRSRDITVVSESGLAVRSDLDFVSQAGANAVLIGESLVKQLDIKAGVKRILQPEALQIV